MMIVLALLLQADWGQFRGPTGQGLTAETKLPIKWSPTENLAWSSPLVGQGHASPVVAGGKVFVSSVRWPGGKPEAAVMPEHHVTAWDAADGKQAWDLVVEPGPWLRSDFRSGPGGGYAAPTPATDGRRLFVAFGSSVLAAVGLDGKLAWRKEIRPHTFDVTLGSSPVLFGETVILLCAMAKASDSRLVAFKMSDGEVAWETKLPKTGFGHSTPLLIDVKGKPQLVIVASGGGGSGEALQAFDPADGRRLWWCKAAGDASSPVYGGGLVYVDSGRGSDGTAVDPTGTGDVTATHLKWTAGPLGESIGSALVHGDHVFRLQGSGVVKVWTLAGGQETDKQKFQLGSTWASPIADGNGRIYFATAGKSVVVKAGPKLEVLATNDLGDPNHASPAVANGRLYLLGQKQLWCVAAR